MLHNRPGKRRKSIRKIPEYFYNEYLSPLTSSLIHRCDYYMSRALTVMVLNESTPEAKLLQKYRYAKRTDLDVLANLTFDFLKTSPKYHDDTVCMQFMEDNLIPYYEVDNTKTGTYEM